MNSSYILEFIWSIIAYFGIMGRQKYKLASVPIILRQFRNRLKLSQETVGERMGLSSGNYISRLELGKDYPSIRTLIRVAKALGVRPGEMLDAISDREDAEQAKAGGQEK